MNSGCLCYILICNLHDGAGNKIPRPSYFSSVLLQSSGYQFRRYWAHNRLVFLLLRYTEVILNFFLCKVHLIVSRDVLFYVPALNSAVISRVVANLLLRAMCASSLSLPSFTSLHRFFPSTVIL